MQKPLKIYGFFALYIGLIVIGFLFNEFVFHDIYTHPENLNPLINSIAQTSLTFVYGNVFSTSIPTEYLVFSLIVTQLSGIVFLSYLLWLCWKLYNSNSSDVGFRDAIKLTVIVSFAVELILVLFFLYTVPGQQTENNYLNKIFVAIFLSVNSFNNAGLSHIQHLLKPELIEQNYILQIGLIFGMTMGSLGIFVINELFSTKQLRQRLYRPEIDWSLITKVSVFGTIFTLGFFSVIFYYLENNNYLAEKNFIESSIASVYKISNARGFGLFLSENTELTSSSIVKLLFSFFGAGPFSTGGGLTLLCLVWSYSLFAKGKSLNSHKKLSIMLTKNLLIYSLISFNLLTILLIINDPGEKIWNVIKDQWVVFSTNQLIIDMSANWSGNLLIGFTSIAGRMGFVIAGFITLRQLHN